MLRAYIRDLNRALPFLVNSGWDLKNYFGLVGYWLKQIGSITDVEMFAKMTLNPWSFWKPTDSQGSQDIGKASSPDNVESFDPKDSPCNLDGE